MHFSLTKEPSLCHNFFMVAFCRKIFTVFLVALLLSPLGAAELVSSKIKDISFNEAQNEYTCEYKGVKRSFILCLPEKCNGETAIVVMLHGLGGSAASFKLETQFDEAALLRNYAVIYIDGIVDPNRKTDGKGWHYHQDDFSKADVAFIVEIVRACQKSFGLGPRCFAAGFSNGGFMVNKLAVSGSKIFTGVASVGGMMPKDVWESKKCKSKIGYMQVNGTKDDVVPMEFLQTDKYNNNPSMEKVIGYYAAVNKIPPEYETVSLADVTTLRNYSSRVWWVIIQDGRHSWPKQQFSKIDISNLILDFFDQL